MSTKSPIFPISADPPLFSDYGFDPQIHHLRKHRRETTSLHKPFSRDDKKKLWWRNALHFFKRKWVPNNHSLRRRRELSDSRPRAAVASASVPLYITETRSGPTTPRRTVSWSARNGEVEITYVSLRDLNMEPLQRVSTSAIPIYLVN